MPAEEANIPIISPNDAAASVEAGTAVLVDVREADEWAETGVAAPAMLLSFSDFRRGRLEWKPFLAQHRNKQIILYCASGMRSGVAAEILSSEGCDVANLGGFGRWTGAGLPVRNI